MKSKVESSRVGRVETIFWLRLQWTGSKILSQELVTDKLKVKNPINREYHLL